MSGFVGDLSAAQAAALDDFKKKLATVEAELLLSTFASQDVHAPEHEPTILRFLRARSFNLDQAFGMLLDCMRYVCIF